MWINKDISAQELADMCGIQHSYIIQAMQKMKHDLVQLLNRLERFIIL